MSSTISFQDVGKIKNQLLLSLGDKSSTYLKLMKRWFKMELTKIEFDIEISKILTPEQFKIHNRLVAKLFRTCSDYQVASTPSSKRKRQHSASFQVAAILDYICDKKGSDKFNNNENKPTEPVKYFFNEMCILDDKMLFGRFMHAAWENDLDGAYRDCAKLLTVAVQNLLKNIITAILCERCGYKVKGTSFIHEMGTSVPNPWLLSATKWNEPETFTSRVSAKLNANLIGIDLALGFEQESEPPTREQIEQNILYCTAKVNRSPSEEYNRKAISIPEAMNALRINRSVILSESIYFACMERLISAYSHPGRDSPEEQEKSCGLQVSNH